MKLFTLIADVWKMDGGVAFGVVPKSIWKRMIEPDENNMVDIVTRCLLIQYDDKNILVDVGFGNKRNEKYYAVRCRDNNTNIHNSLKSIGLQADDITDILFTHLHDDHVGAATESVDDNIELVFKNANYWVSQSHWNWAMNPNKREGAAYFKDNLEPLLNSGRLHLLQAHEQAFSQIKLQSFDGHTRGQLIPFVEYNDRTLVFVADFIPTAYNIPLPYMPSVDIEPLKTIDEKEAFLNLAADNGYVLVFQHDYFCECCTVKHSDRGVVLDEKFTLCDI